MTILSMEEILKNDVQEQLAGSASVLIKTIMDLSSKAKAGSDTITVPRASGLSLTDITSGTRSGGTGFTFAGDQLLLNQAKEVAHNIAWEDGLDSAVDVEQAFWEGAPRVYAGGIEALIATQLETVSANDFDTGVAATFTIDHIAQAKRLLDIANVPKTNRYMAVNAVEMELLASLQEFEDGSKSLSAEALKQGVVSQVKGFNVVQSEDVNTNKIYFYHQDAVAFALHAKMQAIAKVDEQFAQKFLALRGKYGAKALDAGVRKLTMSLVV